VEAAVVVAAAGKSNGPCPWNRMPPARAGGVFQTESHSEASTEADYVSVDETRLQPRQRNTRMSGLSPIAGSLPIGSITPSQCLQPVASLPCTGRAGLSVISSQ